MSSTIANVFRRWDTLILWSTPEKFWIEATKSKAHLLQINRNDNESKCVISLEPHLGQIPASATKKTIHGIIGLVELPLCQFLLVITRKVQVGDDPDDPMIQVNKIDYQNFFMKVHFCIESTQSNL